MEDNDVSEVTEHLAPERPQRVKEGVPWGAILLLIWAIGLLSFSLQNTEQVTVEFLWMEIGMSVAVLVIVTALLTAILTGMGWSIYQRRRREQRAMRRAPKKPKD